MVHRSLGPVVGTLLLMGCAGAAPPQRSREAPRPAATEAPAVPPSSQPSARAEQKTTPPEAPAPEAVPGIPLAKGLLWEASLPGPLPELAASEQRVQLPEPVAIIDVVVDQSDTTWLLGPLAALYRVRKNRLETVSEYVCLPPRPKDLHPDEPYPTIPPRGHALYVSSEGLHVLGSWSGATAPYFWSALLRANGKWECSRPPFTVGANVYGTVRSGQALWLYVYGVVSQVFPNPELRLPDAQEAGAALWLPDARPGAAPLFFAEENQQLHQFDGIRWNPVSSPVPEAVDTESLQVDEAGTVWGVAGGSGKQRSWVVAFDSGQGYRAVPVPEELGAIEMRAAGKDRWWLIGERKVAYWNGRELAVADSAVPIVLGCRVDHRGRLWMWGGSKPEEEYDFTESELVVALYPGGDN